MFGTESGKNISKADCLFELKFHDLSTFLTINGLAIACFVDYDFEDYAGKQDLRQGQKRMKIPQTCQDFSDG